MSALSPRDLCPLPGQAEGSVGQPMVKKDPQSHLAGGWWACRSGEIRSTLYWAPGPSPPPTPRSTTLTFAISDSPPFQCEAKERLIDSNYISSKPATDSWDVCPKGGLGHEKAGWTYLRFEHMSEWVRERERERDGPQCSEAPRTTKYPPNPHLSLQPPQNHCHT